MAIQHDAATVMRAAPVTAGAVRPRRAEMRPALTANSAAVAGPGVTARPARTGP